MKRIRLLILLGAVALALPFGLSRASATGTSPTTAITIQPFAQYDDAGFVLHVGLYVRCTGGLGLVQVSVDQYPPQSPTPAHGLGSDDVVCDGKTHEAAVTIGGIKFDAGKAIAEATVIPPPGYGDSVTTKRVIAITVQRG